MAINGTIADVTRIVQISDLHLGSKHNVAQQQEILSAFLSAFGRELDKRGPADLIVITGDVFDCATMTPRVALDALEALLYRIVVRAGKNVPIAMIPGNHDRRRAGLFGRARAELWQACCDWAQKSEFPLWVHSADERLHAQVVPRAFHGMPATVIAYDSTWIERGWVSAGGVIRRQDLLYAFARAEATEPSLTHEPVFLLVHHHIVPTPQTDLGKVETEHLHPLARRSFDTLLPTLFAHADHEELTMTALGAGTALSCLHSLGRPVIVLHGHKHIASARLLSGTSTGQGDVAVLGAGSTGAAQIWSSAETQKPVHLWPSFNLIELDNKSVVADAITFGHKGGRKGQIHTRPLLWLSRERNRFRALPVEKGVRSPGPHLKENRADYTLSRSQEIPGRLDFALTRTIVGDPEKAPKRYFEPLSIYPKARYSAGVQDSSLELRLNDTTTFQAVGGLAFSATELLAIKNDSGAFESISLFNRYASDIAELTVRGFALRDFFATAQDLGSGDEVRAAVALLPDGALRIAIPNCAPRTLIRLYFLVEDDRKDKHARKEAQKKRPLARPSLRSLLAP